MEPISTYELTEVVCGTLLQESPSNMVTGAAIDSRQVNPGDVFVAIVGDKVDGHDYLPQADARDASAVLVSRREGLPSVSCPVIVVEDGIKALQHLASRERSLHTGPVIGVTGSNGKTTTKDMLAAVFQTKGACLSTQGNQNTEIGLPLTMLRRNQSHRSMVLEMGMRGRGQIETLCDLAKPTAGIITNIGHSHIELLGSREEIANAKAELLEALPSSGCAVLRAGDPFLRAVANKSRAKVYWYGVTNPDGSSATAHDILLQAQGVEFTAHVLGEFARVKLPIPGLHNVENALGALLMGALHDLSLARMAQALETLSLSPGRLQVREGLRERLIVDDCYNASPLSTKASLSVLGDLAQGRPKVAVLGDMYELGFYEEDAHREVGEAAVSAGVDLLITVGPKSRWIADRARELGMRDVRHYENKQEAVAEAQHLIPEGAVVLVKASYGMHLDVYVRALTSELDPV